MGLEKINYAIDANIEKAERVFPDDYKIKDEEKDSYDELFDDLEEQRAWKEAIAEGRAEARSIGEKLLKSDIFEPSERLAELFSKIGKNLHKDEVCDYGRELNEKYSALDIEEYEEEWDEEYKIDTAEELEEYIEELLK
jgi:hypothetical protein